MTKEKDEIRQCILGLRIETIDKIDEVVSLLSTNSRTDAVARAVKLAHMCLVEMKRGGRIELHRENGDIQELLIKALDD